MSEAEARALEAERALPMPSSRNADERLEALFYACVKDESGEKAYQATRRLVTALRGGKTLTWLFRKLVNAEAGSRGLR